MQQGDVKIFQTTDGGDITITNGVADMSGGLGTAVYLSLFGGNAQDAGGDDTRLQWWGNFGETEPARQYRSRLQYLLGTVPATSGNLRRIEDAAASDLDWLTAEGVADSVTVAATIPTRDRVKISIQIEADGTAEAFEFSANWGAAL